VSKTSLHYSTDSIKAMNETLKENILAQFRTQLQQSILDLLTKQCPLPRRDIVKQLQRARTTIYDNLIKLEKQNIVEKFVRNSGTRGRSLVFWKLII